MTLFKGQDINMREIDRERERERERESLVEFSMKKLQQTFDKYSILIFIQLFAQVRLLHSYLGVFPPADRSQAGA